MFYLDLLESLVLESCITHSLYSGSIIAPNVAGCSLGSITVLPVFESIP